MRQSALPPPLGLTYRNAPINHARKLQTCESQRYLQAQVCRVEQTYVFTGKVVSSVESTTARTCDGGYRSNPTHQPVKVIIHLQQGKDCQRRAQPRAEAPPPARSRCRAAERGVEFMSLGRVLVTHTELLLTKSGFRTLEKHRVKVWIKLLALYRV